VPHQRKAATILALGALCLVGGAIPLTSVAQETTPSPADESSAPPNGAAGAGNLEPPDAAQLLQVPVSTLFPGNVPVQPEIRSPSAGSTEALQRGLEYFISFNCVGCHAPNGAGGMGPSLSNRTFIYGDKPENIYLSIAQGRPNGMPSWGATLPDEVIWDLVAYIKSISQEPITSWGRTISRQTLTIEQVPAEYRQSPRPWTETESFSYGQKPNRAR
jgi:cytochrome c oxidase cbb3-type subunit III